MTILIHQIRFLMQHQNWVIEFLSIHRMKSIMVDDIYLTSHMYAYLVGLRYATAWRAEEGDKGNRPFFGISSQGGRVLQNLGVAKYSWS